MEATPAKTRISDEKDIVICGSSALALMRIPRMWEYFYERDLCSQRVPSKPTNAADLESLQAILSPRYQTLVSKPAALRRSKSHTAHLCSRQLPAGSLVQLKSGFRCVSALYLPLELVQVKSISPLVIIMLLSELLGLYAPDSEEHTGLIQKPSPLITKEQLYDYLEESGSANGTKKLRFALDYVCEKASSPMETLLYLQSSLGFSKGGYGFKDVLVNSELLVDSFIHDNPGLRVRKPDLLFVPPAPDSSPFKAVVVEYNGAWHDRSDQVRADDIRRNELLAAGIKVYVIWYEDYVNTNTMDKLFFAIRADLGLPEHRVSQKQAIAERAARENLIRELLLAKNNWEQELLSP